MTPTSRLKPAHDEPGERGRSGQPEDPPQDRHAEVLPVIAHGTTVVGYMGGMTGRSTDPDDSGPGLAAAGPDSASGDPEISSSRTSISDQGAPDPSPVEPGGAGRAGRASPAGVPRPHRRVPGPSSPSTGQPGARAAAGLPGWLRSMRRRVRSGLEAAASDSAAAPEQAAVRARPPAAADGARADAAAARAQAAAQDDHVPRLLRITAAWAWRLILVAHPDLRRLPGLHGAAPGRAPADRRPAAHRAAPAAVGPAPAGRLPAAAGHLVHPAGRGHRHRGRRHAHRQPGQRRLPHARRRGQADRHPGAALPGRPAVPPARRPAAAAHQRRRAVHLPAQGRSSRAPSSPAGRSSWSS